MGQILLIKFAEMNGATLSKSWTPNVTHVIAALDGDGAYVRTFKIFMAILAGKWIVTMDCKLHLDILPYCFDTFMCG